MWIYMLKKEIYITPLEVCKQLTEVFHCLNVDKACRIIIHVKFFASCVFGWIIYNLFGFSSYTCC